MPEYVVVGRIHVRDQEKMRAYKAGVAGTLQRFNAAVLVRAKQSGCGQNEIVVIRFPDLSAALAWHQSPEYQALIPVRDQAAYVTLELLEMEP